VVDVESSALQIHHVKKEAASATTISQDAEENVRICWLIRKTAAHAKMHVKFRMKFV